VIPGRADLTVIRVGPEYRVGAPEPVASAPPQDSATGRPIRAATCQGEDIELATSLHDLSVPSYPQTARAVAGFLGPAARQCGEPGSSAEVLVDGPLAEIPVRNAAWARVAPLDAKGPRIRAH
jgi:hypothetical protein